MAGCAATALTAGWALGSGLLSGVFVMIVVVKNDSANRAQNNEGNDRKEYIAHGLSLPTNLRAPRAIS